MSRSRNALSFLGSRTLTIWIAGLFVLYYLSVSLWSKEAFASFVLNLAKNNFFRLAYVLFVLNVAFGIAAEFKGPTRSTARLLLRLPLYAGLLLFLASFFMSVNVRQNTRILLGEGDPVEIPWERTRYQVVRVKPAVEEKALRTERSAVFDYEPGLTVIAANGERTDIPAFPPKRIGNSYLHVLNFGIGPGVELKKAGMTVSKGYIALRLTPFGAVDSFRLDPWPYTFYLSILPNRIVSKGRETGREYDLRTPLYSVEVVRGDKMIAKRETRDTLAFDGDMTLYFFAPSDWVLLEAVHDPFYRWYVCGLALLLFGAPLYPFSCLVKDCSSGEMRTRT